MRSREHYATAQLRPESYSQSTDVAWVACSRGDMVRMAHDVLLVGLKPGRIKAIVDDGEDPPVNAVGAGVDEPLDMEEVPAGTELGLAIFPDDRETAERPEGHHLRC